MLKKETLEMSQTGNIITIKNKDLGVAFADKLSAKRKMLKIE